MTTARPDLGRLLGSISALLTASSLSDEAVGDAFGEAMAALARFDFIVVFAYRGQRAADRSLFDLRSRRLPGIRDALSGRSLPARSVLPRSARAAARHFPNARTGAGPLLLERILPNLLFADSASRGDRLLRADGRRGDGGAFADAQGEHARLLRARVRPSEAGRTFRGRAGRAVLVRSCARVSTRRRAGSASPDAAHPRAKGVWGQLDLTAREAAIVELVLQGHSSEAVGRRLGIATGTVKVHRRNVYRKLGISSQTQLLSLYLKSM